MLISMSRIKKHHEIDFATRLIADWRSMAVAHAVYENSPVRYTDLSNMLDFSPTILSQKLMQLTNIGIIDRIQKDGSKEVLYSSKPITNKMVKAYHILEDIEHELVNKYKKQEVA